MAEIEASTRLVATKNRLVCGKLMDVTKTENGERGTGNGERGTGVWEQVYSGNPPENSKWRRKRCLQTLILSLGRRLQCN